MSVDDVVRYYTSLDLTTVSIVVGLAVVGWAALDRSVTRMFGQSRLTFATTVISYLLILSFGLFSWAKSQIASAPTIQQKSTANAGIWTTKLYVPGDIVIRASKLMRSGDLLVAGELRKAGRDQVTRAFVACVDPNGRLTCQLELSEKYNTTFSAIEVNVQDEAYVAGEWSTEDGGRSGPVVAKVVFEGSTGANARFAWQRVFDRFAAAPNVRAIRDRARLALSYDIGVAVKLDNAAANDLLIVLDESGRTKWERITQAPAGYRTVGLLGLFADTYEWQVVEALESVLPRVSSTGSTGQVEKVTVAGTRLKKRDFTDKSPITSVPTTKTEIPELVSEPVWLRGISWRRWRVDNKTVATHVSFSALGADGRTRSQHLSPLSQEPTEIWLGALKTGSDFLLVGVNGSKGQNAITGYRFSRWLEGGPPKLTNLPLPRSTDISDLAVSQAYLRQNTDPQIGADALLVLSGSIALPIPHAQNDWSLIATAAALGCSTCGGRSGQLDHWLAVYTLGESPDSQNLQWRTFGETADDALMSIEMDLRGDMYAAGFTGDNVGCCSEANYHPAGIVLKLSQDTNAVDVRGLQDR